MSIWPEQVLLVGIGVLLVAIAAFFRCRRAQKDPKRRADDYEDTIIVTRQTRVTRLATETTESIERDP